MEERIKKLRQCLESMPEITGEDIAIAVYESFPENQDLRDDVEIFLEQLQHPEEKCYNEGDDDEDM